MQAQEPAACP